jgi:hypothetical protein
LQRNHEKGPTYGSSLLIFHSRNDKLISHGKKHDDYFIEWAVGEKELKFYPDGEHVCANYLDEVIPDTVLSHYVKKLIK